HADRGVVRRGGRGLLGGDHASVIPGEREGSVVVDTGVFAADLLPTKRALASSYQPFLAGRRVFISFITVAELRYGARRAGWGDSRQTAALHQERRGPRRLGR